MFSLRPVDLSCRVAATHPERSLVYGAASRRRDAVRCGSHHDFRYVAVVAAVRCAEGRLHLAGGLILTKQAHAGLPRARAAVSVYCGPYKMAPRAETALLEQPTRCLCLCSRVHSVCKPLSAIHRHLAALVSRQSSSFVIVNSLLTPSLRSAL